MTTQGTHFGRRTLLGASALGATALASAAPCACAAQPDRASSPPGSCAVGIGTIA